MVAAGYCPASDEQEAVLVIDAPVDMQSWCTAFCNVVTNVFKAVTNVFKALDWMRAKREDPMTRSKLNTCTDSARNKLKKRISSNGEWSSATFM